MPEPITLTLLLGEFHQKLQNPPTIPRNAVFPVAHNKIKVAIGMRRTGKTAFLFQTIHALLEKHVPLSQILYLNFEDDRLMPLTRENCAQLIEEFYTLYPENHEKHCYLFLDEIQMVPDWAVIVRRLFDSKNVEIYLSGSSSKLLSREIHTSLRGRSLATEIWPLSFEEYLIAKQLNFQSDLFSKKTQDLLKKYFGEYLKNGGFPEVIYYDEQTRIKTLQDYIDVVIYRDIIERHHIQNTPLLKYMILFILQNPGASFSINKFYHDVKSQGYIISKNTLHEYLHYIEDAYLAFSVGLYDRSIRKTQSNPKKIYAIDPGLTSAVKFSNQTDFGKLFENVIFLDLKRQGYDVFYYLTKERYEVDFLVKGPQGKLKLLQVCWDTSNKETLAREERALEIAKQELQIEGELITLYSYLKKYAG